jgi:hypothetical protein
MIDALALDRQQFSELKSQLRMITERVAEGRQDATA